MDARLPPVISMGDVQFEPVSGELRLDGQTQRLRPQTAAVLAHLLQHPGEIVSRDALLKSVWGDVLVTENSLTQCVAEIRRALGAERESWLTTQARRGYRFVAPPAIAAGDRDCHLPDQPELPADIGSAAAPTTATTVTTATPHRMAPILAALAVVCALAGAGAWYWRTTPAVPAAQLSLAVLPFELVGTSDQSRWFAEVVGEDITFNLARIPGARVISHVSTRAYVAGAANLERVRSELDVRYVVVGSVDRDVDRVTLRLQLVDTVTAAIRWSDRIDTAPAELQATEREVANRVANALHVRLVDDAAARIQRTVANPAADDLALQGWAAWNRGTPDEVKRARELALRALALDERSVMAWKTLASWHLRARINQSEPAELAEAGAEHAAGRALAIDPDHPLVHTVWGAAQVLRGRYAQGQQALEHEIRTNPSHPVAYSYLGIAHLMSGEPGLAIERYRQALAISPRDPRRSRFERHLALAYLHNGDLAQAQAMARSATRAPQVDRAAWAMLAAACAAAADAPCIEEARVGLRKAWPDVSVAAVESEWPPPTPAFDRQHEAFVRALTSLLAMR